MPTKGMSSHRLMMLLGKLNNPISGGKVPGLTGGANVVNFEFSRGDYQNLKAFWIPTRLSAPSNMTPVIT